MSVSIYYSAERDRPLSGSEQVAVAKVIAGFDTDRFADVDGEPFCVYESAEEHQIFTGATKLPLRDDPEATADALLYWMELLSAVRRVLHDASWHVHMDDVDIPWNDTKQAYTWEE